MTSIAPDQSLPQSAVKSPRRYFRAVVVVLLVVAALVGFRPAAVYWKVSCADGLLQRWNAEGALGHLVTAQKLAPENGEVHFLLARCYRRLGDFKLVHKHLERAWQIGYPVERIRREHWLVQAQNGEFGSAEAHLQEMVIEPGEDATQICEAFVSGYFLTYQFHKALPLLNVWQADFPDDSQTYYFRGRYEEHLMHWTEAATQYRKALEFAPERFEIRLNLASILLTLRKFDEATDQFRRCLEERPNDHNVRVGYGQCLLEQGENERARELFQAVIEADPGNVEAAVALGDYELNENHPAEALKWLRVATDKQPYHRQARYALASALAATGAQEEAAPHFEFVAKAQEAQQRLQSLRQKIQADFENVDLRCEYGRLLLEFSDPNEGVAWLRALLSHYPQHRDSHRALIDYYVETGNEELAAKHRNAVESAKQTLESP